MTNYTELSDFEINKRAIKIVGKGFISEGCKKCYIDINKEFNPCNNWSDAGPIIVENAIGLMPFKNGKAKAWDLSLGIFGCDGAEDKNPLRAAMIVFLLMNEV